MTTTIPTPTKQPPAAEHASPADRDATGKAARRMAPRAALADFEPAAARPDPVALLEEQAVTRLAELVPIRYGRMLLSPFAFYRGAALIMASDLAPTPTSGLKVQACGDAHMSNFGVFGSPDRSLVFDVNDFDETLPGPWEWDVKRLAASLAVAGRERGFTAKQRAAAVRASAEGYRTEMRSLATMRNLDLWYQRLDVDRVLAETKAEAARRDRKLTEAAVAKARTRDSTQAFSKLTHVVDGEPRIISDPPLIVPIEELTTLDPGVVATYMDGLLRKYRRSLESHRRHLLEQFQLVHVARKVVGVGSVGTRAWILLLLGRDNADPLFLQVKEAQPSVMERFVGKSSFSNHGQRVVAGQRLMQATSDIFLGWIRADSPLDDGASWDFYFRQLRDWKGSVDLDQMSPRSMLNYGRTCGQTLARGHARSGDRIAIAAYLGKSTVFDEALPVFAEAYADQNERDYETLRSAVADGRVVAESGL